MLSAPDFEQKKLLVVLLNEGERISFKNDNIIVTDKDEEIRHQSSCYKLFALFIIGHFTVTTGLLQRSKKFGFSISLFTHGLQPYMTFSAKAEGNTILRRKQYEYKSNNIAQYLVNKKILQQISVLNARRKKSSELKQVIADLKNQLSKLTNYDSSIELDSLLGIEGFSSRIYFNQMFDDMDWRGRKPRVKNDITNVLLDIGYTKLFCFIESLLNLYGFDIYKGVYHQTFYQRKSLVCDLMEPFRPLIDARIHKAHRLGQIHNEDFELISGQYRIFGKNAQPYISLLLSEILSHKMQLFYFVQQYYRAFMQDKPIENYPDIEL